VLELYSSIVINSQNDIGACMGVGRWSCMDIEFLINFGFMVVKSGWKWLF